MKCPHCHAEYADDPTLAGTYVQCPSCGNQFAATAAVGVAVSVAPVRSSSRSTSARRAPERGSELVAWLLVGLLAVNAVTAGLMLTWEMRYQQMRRTLEQATQTMEQDVQRQLERLQRNIP